MAKQDKETYESYAKDMFDNPPAGPMGVHRGARSMASRALPYVIVVIVALLAGLLFRRELAALPVTAGARRTAAVPVALIGLDETLRFTFVDRNAVVRRGGEAKGDRKSVV